MIPYRVIEAKREGRTLGDGELGAFFQGYLDGQVTEYQMSAFLMAVYFQGLDTTELDTLVELMLGSGARLDLGYLDGPRIDKHSTGGVGDKVSLVLAPLAAELGIYVPMMSGRGLGHTGGTLDKLESIPGFRTDLSLERFQAVLSEVGCAMIGQTAEIAPLDRRLYALRNVTATVPSIPLIAASIMSKKLAEGLTGLVLDVKTGPGAFIPEPERGLQLAETMVALGASKGTPTVALLTAMDRPLGKAIGHGLEAREALECLAGAGPEDLVEVTTALVGEMLAVAGLAEDGNKGAEAARATLASGAAVERMARLVALQGGDASVVTDPSRLGFADHVETLHADRDGFVQQVHPVPLGYGVVELGGGRRTLDDTIDPAVGFTLHVGLGDEVREGTALGSVHVSDAARLAEGVAILRSAIEVGDGPGPAPLPLVGDRVQAG